MQYGEGPVHAIVLHDWFCDHTNWDAMMPYLTPDQFTYVFADLRGYGDSRHLPATTRLRRPQATSSLSPIA